MLQQAEQDPLSLSQSAQQQEAAIQRSLSTKAEEHIIKEESAIPDEDLGGTYEGEEELEDVSDSLLGDDEEEGEPSQAEDIKPDIAFSAEEPPERPEPFAPAPGYVYGGPTPHGEALNPRGPSAVRYRTGDWGPTEDEAKKPKLE